MLLITSINWVSSIETSRYSLFTKPENVLLNWQGHVKIVDFGLSRFQNDIQYMSHSFIGTAGYVPPEILTGKGHNYLTDAYTLGVFIYDLLHASVPIRSLKMRMYDESTVEELHKKIAFREDLSLEGRDILQRLLSTDPKNRLLGDTDIKAILFHPWLKNYRQYIDSPVAPEPVYIPDLNEPNFESAYNLQLNTFVNELEGTFL